MSAFDEWYDAIDPDERPDHTDAQEAFNAGMTMAARRLTQAQRRERGH